MEYISHYKYCSFDEKNSILYHEVNNENFGSKELFVSNISIFSSLIEMIRPKGIIVKVYKDPDFFELELNHFMQNTLFRSLENAGVKKVAFYLDNPIIIEKLRQYERNDFVEGRFFGDFKLAEQWIKNTI